MTKSITISGVPTHTVNFQYSADNERILKNERQGTTNNNSVYIRGNSDYPITEKANLNNSLSDKIYIYGPTGLIAVKDGYFTYFVIKDHLGSTRVLFRSVGTYYSTYDYSPFGSLMRSSINGDVVYKFTGQEYDNEAVLYNFRARLYDDELGIFYAGDPSGQNFAPYSYAGNNPVVRVDPNGKFFLELAMIISAATTAFESVVAHGTDIRNGLEFLGYAGAGAGVGAGSAYLGYAIGTSGIFFSNTLGLMTSSFVNSAGMSAITGQNQLDINFGIGTFNFSSDKFDWVFNKNTHGFEWITDVLNTVNFANDVYAAAFVDFSHQDVREAGVKKLAEENDNNIELADRFSNKPISNLRETWKPVGKDITFSELAHQKFGSNNPPLGKWIYGVGERFGRLHVGNFQIAENVYQTFVHSDVFDINKNLLWHAFEWLIEPSEPVGVWHP
jgi:RHS repeat-associated protein